MYPAKDLGAQAYEYYCRVGGKIRSDHYVMQNSRHFDQIRGSIICAKLGRIQIDRYFTAVFRLSTVHHLM